MMIFEQCTLGVTGCCLPEVGGARVAVSGVGAKGDGYVGGEACVGGEGCVGRGGRWNGALWGAGRAL